MKKIIMSVGMLLLAAALFGTSTYAWFSMNRDVSAKGMKVSAHVDSSLIITQSALPTATDAAVDVNFGESTANVLYNSTHSTDSTHSATRLKTVSDPQDVGSSSGLARTGKTLTYVTAENSEGKKQYYKDYVVYVASSGSAITGKTITFTITGDDNDTTKESEVNKAISVDIYYITGASSVVSENSTFLASGAYLGALNLAGLDASKNNASDIKTSLAATIGIPLADGSSALAVLFRVYLDGALYSSYDSTNVANCKTYVNNSDYIDLDMNLSFSISCAE